MTDRAVPLADRSSLASTWHRSNRNATSATFRKPRSPGTMQVRQDTPGPARQLLCRERVGRNRPYHTDRRHPRRGSPPLNLSVGDGSGAEPDGEAVVVADEGRVDVELNPPGDG